MTYHPVAVDNLYVEKNYTEFMHVYAERERERVRDGNPQRPTHLAGYHKLSKALFLIG